ncbi:MAG: hypothetical protein D6769_03030 [Methanobacteriota archaeon]|nr:MAG: hypothetical protein D6769_03030 [Euryarchaeota archaeon]
MPDIFANPLSQGKEANKEAMATIFAKAVIVSIFIRAEEKERTEGNRKPPKNPPPMAMKIKKAKKPIKIEQLRNMKMPAMGGKGKENEKKERDTTILRPNKIQEKYYLIYKDPETEKEEIIEEEQKVFYDSVEQKLVEESAALLSEKKIDDYISSPLIAKDEDKIEEEASKKLENLSKAPKMFGKDEGSELIKELDEYVEETPKNLQDAEMRKEKVLKELEEQEKILEESTKTIKEKGLEEFKKKTLSKLPPLTKKRVLLLIEKKKEELIYRLLVLQTTFIKWLKKRLKGMSLKDIANLAKNRVASILSAIVKMLHHK